MGEVFKRHTLVGLTIEQDTESTPEPTRFYVIEHGEVRESCASLTIAQVAFEMVEEQILENDPALAKKAGLVQKERQFREIISARAQSAAIGKTKATAKGGKGGRSGV